MHPHSRRYYLQDIPLDEASDRYNDALHQAGALAPTGSEQVPIQDALGRITAEAVWALRSVPHYDAAAMDGVAVRSIRHRRRVREFAPRPHPPRPSRLGRYRRPRTGRIRRRDNGRGRPRDRRLHNRNQVPRPALQPRETARRGHRRVRATAAPEPSPPPARPGSLRRRRNNRSQRSPKAHGRHNPHRNRTRRHLRPPQSGRHSGVQLNRARRHARPSGVRIQPACLPSPTIPTSSKTLLAKQSATSTSFS